MYCSSHVLAQLPSPSIFWTVARAGSMAKACDRNLNRLSQPPGALRNLRFWTALASRGSVELCTGNDLRQVRTGFRGDVTWGDDGQRIDSILTIVAQCSPQHRLMKNHHCIKLCPWLGLDELERGGWSREVRHELCLVPAFRTGCVSSRQGSLRFGAYRSPSRWY